MASIGQRGELEGGEAGGGLRGGGTVWAIMDDR